MLKTLASKSHPSSGFAFSSVFSPGLSKITRNPLFFFCLLLHTLVDPGNVGTCHFQDVFSHQTEGSRPLKRSWSAGTEFKALPNR